MRTRLLWLGLLCLALLFSLGLLVVTAEELPPPPVQAQYLMPTVVDFRAAQRAADFGGHSLLAAPCQSIAPVMRLTIPQTLSRDANGIPLSGGSYADAAYTAFHYPDEAG
jgi:hypothetical protein